MEHKDKIDFDLNFLDENTKEKPKHSPKNNGGDSSSKDPNWIYHKDGSGAKNTNNKSSNEMSDSAKKWAWGIGIFLFFILIGSFFGDSSPNSSSSDSNYAPPVNNGAFIGSEGELFNCYGSTYDKAMAMRPTDSESTGLDNRISANNNEKAAIEAMYIDEYDQNSVDSYNKQVDNFNYRNTRLKSDLAAFNAKVNAYNNFLDVNCTPQ